MVRTQAMIGVLKVTKEVGHACRYTTTYTQIYTKLNGTWPAINYTSPVLHHTVLTGLEPATMYALCKTLY